MQVIIPVAGKGTRMRPHTHTTPKPLLWVAGKPVIDYILDELEKLDFVTEIIFITGHLGDKFKDHVTNNYDFKMKFEEQKVLDGSSGAIRLAEPHINEDVLVMFADTIFDVDLTQIKKVDSDGIIWAKKVEDYSRFGIMLTDDDGNLKEMKEKPDQPYTRLANIGIYYVKDYKMMYECIQEQYDDEMKTKGEYNFPEALGMMAEKGKKLKILEADGWYDTGKPETMLPTQEILLETRHNEGNTKDTEIKGNVFIADNAEVKGCIIGPNVSIGPGCVVKDSVIRNSIINSNSTVVDSNLYESLVGEGAYVEGAHGKVNVGDNSDIHIGKNESNP